ncbi:hypothetical protein [Coleofasciculus sp. G2-EDA-02]|uniref:hypothetical protein n=1 Tax=Coleofasciculus sp. G2-EDA-02 TaxID=3069529 RepID=UPI0032FD5041
MGKYLGFSYLFYTPATNAKIESLLFIILPAQLKGCEDLMKTWQLDEACVKMEGGGRVNKSDRLSA